jgi:hypothetical protein
MKRTIALLVLLSGLSLAAGCSRRTADAPAGATPTPMQKPDAVNVQAAKVEAMTDKPITAVSPAAAASSTP